MRAHPHKPASSRNVRSCPTHPPENARARHGHRFANMSVTHLREVNNLRGATLFLFKSARQGAPRKSIPDARRTLGAEHDLTLCVRSIFMAECLYQDPSASTDEEPVAEAIEISRTFSRRTRRVFGADHPRWTGTSGSSGGGARGEARAASTTSEETLREILASLHVVVRRQLEPELVEQ